MALLLTTHKHDLRVDGLEYDPHCLQPATLAGFDSLTIDGALVLSYDDLREMPLALVSDIWMALENAAQAECESWQETARDLRAWLAKR